MWLKISGWFVIICLWFCAVCLAVNILRVLKQLCKRTGGRKRKKEWIQRWIVQILVFAAGIGILLFVACCLQGGLAEWSKYLEAESKTTVSDETSEVRYAEAVQKIPFHNVVVNEEHTVWEELLNERLLYRNYLTWEKEADSFDAMWRCYRKYYVEASRLPKIEIDEVVKLAEMFYGSEILPENHRTLSEVEEDTPKLDDRMHADVTIYQNEFWLRAVPCNKASSDNELYQAGRAADDVFKILAAGDYTYKEMVFYGSMAVSFYLACIENYAGNIDLELVYYRIAEIYLYFYKYIFPDDGDASYHLHFLLSAEAFLMLAEKEHKKKSGDKDILEKLPYFSCYYAEILYKFLVIYDSGYEWAEDLCCEYAEQYLNSSYSTGDSKVRSRESCEDILTNLVGFPTQ